jgi:glycosyltransferase involved in cell wall biosynthesis
MSTTKAVILLDHASERSLANAISGLNIVTLPNTVEIDDIDRICKPVCQLPSSSYNGSTRIAFIGHVLIAKGIRELVSACVRLSLGSLSLSIVGPYNKELYDELRATASKMHNGVWMTMTGPVDHAQAVRHMAASDIFVLPSYTEGMPYSVLEAMACGCAIIGTTAGAVPEMLDIGGPQECGIIVPPQDEIRLAGAIQTLAGNSDLRRSMGLRARQRVEQLYSRSIGCSQLLGMWRSVCQ